MSKEKLFKLDSNDQEIIIKNNKTKESKQISLTNPSDIEFNSVLSWVLKSVSDFDDWQNFEINEVDISDFNISNNLSLPMHRELLLSFKNMFENEIKSIFLEIKNLKQN